MVTNWVSNRVRFLLKKSKGTLEIYVVKLFITLVNAQTVERGKRLKIKSFSVFLVIVLLLNILISLFAFQLANAEVLPTQVNLYGYVKDINGVAIESSNIYISDNDREYVGNIVPNSSGYYSIAVPYHESFTLNVKGFGVSPNLLYYIPQSKTVSTKLSSIEINFALQPGANILVNTYDNNGTLLREEDFKEFTNSNAFVTDINNLPSYAVFDSIHDNISQADDYNYNLTRPACIVLPKTPFCIHLLWNVPGFGKVMLTADNSSNGYLVRNQGELIEINFNHEAAKSKITAFQRDFDLARSQNHTTSNSIITNLEQSKAHLRTAETHLSNNNMESSIEELTLALNYSMWGHEQLLVDEAKTNIEVVRKADVSLKIIDSSGQPLENCTVNFKQVNSDFLFGADPFGKAHQFDQNYANLLRDAGVNYAYVMAPWGSIEPSPGQFDWSVIDSYQNINTLTNNGFRTMGSLSLWWYRGVGNIFSPTYQDGMTFGELKTSSYEHMKALSSRYKDSISVWEFNEQNSAWSNVLNLTWSQKIDVYKSCIQGIKEGNPNASILWDSNALPYEFGVEKLENLDQKAGGISFMEFLKMLIDNQVEVDIIGLELYYSGVNTDGYAPPGLDLVAISNLLDRYSSFGKPIYVREFSAPSTQVSQSSTWHESWSEANQAEYLKDVYSVCFSKPLVKEIGWSYGVEDSDVYIISGGLLNRDMSPKLSYYELKDLTSSWKTNGSELTDSSGRIGFRGFTGTYQITITTSTGYAYTQNIKVSENSTNETAIKVPDSNSKIIILICIVVSILIALTIVIAIHRKRSKKTTKNS